MNEKQEYDVIVIGGGPAGMMAAGRVTECNPNATVLLIEKNKRLGEKLSITGGGRCNITNAIFDTREFLTKYEEGGKFLYSTFAQFSIQDTFTFFEKRNLPLVTQAHNRVFPLSEKASDVTRVMVQYCTHPNITILTNTTVKKINIDCPPGFIPGSRNTNKKIPKQVRDDIKTIEYIETSKGERYSAKSYILATGGLSHPETGSTGDGFHWLKLLGHTIKTPTPTLVPWEVSNPWIHMHSGTPIDNCKLTVDVNDKKYFSCTGRILCTHTGLSGPLVINSSPKLQDALLSGIVTVYLDLYPSKNHKELDMFILDIFETNKNKKLKNVLSEITGLSSSEFLIEKYIPYNIEAQVNSVSKEFRKSLVQLLKKIPLNVVGLEGYEKSIVADGGVPLAEIDTKTMHSQKISNLYITGDLINIRRPSGGYSLQLCWTTGYVAGLHCLDKK
jgi:predicted Rossmann fold flavoprotein